MVIFYNLLQLLNVEDFMLVTFVPISTATISVLVCPSIERSACFNSPTTLMSVYGSEPESLGVVHHRRVYPSCKGGVPQLAVKVTSPVEPAGIEAGVHPPKTHPSTSSAGNGVYSPVSIVYFSKLLGFSTPCPFMSYIMAYSMTFHWAVYVPPFNGTVCGTAGFHPANSYPVFATYGADSWLP